MSNGVLPITTGGAPIDTIKKYIKRKIFNGQK